MSSCVARVSLLEEVERLSVLVKELKQARGTFAKIQVLDQDARVQAHAGVKMPPLPEEEFLIKSLMVIHQYEEVFHPGGLSKEELEERKKSLLEKLQLVESFYEEMGGIVGYHCTLLEFLCQPRRRFFVDKSRYHAPRGVDLSQPSSALDEMIYHSIDKMESLAEMYPVGGAADRLKLHDPETRMPIPAAMLPFNGQTLLGKLVEDLQAREYLYFKLKNKQIIIPIAMMTSQEKNNHQQILRLCEKNRWFCRPQEKFAFFSQPLVPVVGRDGRWILSHPMQPLLKPGGHGVIWKLARDCGVLSWLIDQGASKAIVRQINNPVSSEDSHLIAFSGYGLKENKRFGFASCERQVKASEGINVVVEEELEEGFSYTLTNIEYCDFPIYNIQDEPVEPDGRFSKFPSNTNLLFVDLPSIAKAVEECPIPGMLVNVKKMAIRKMDCEVVEEVARLESTMQNVADCFRKVSSRPLELHELSHLDTYITFNQRQKTISATKKEFSLGSSLLETPEGCFEDVLANARDLLVNHCGFELPPLGNKGESFTDPSFLFQYHPALGPLYSIIAKKLRTGQLLEKSELRLQIAECDIENLSVQGSCLIVAERIMGSCDQGGILCYSNHVGRCTLKNVTIKNRGIDYSRENLFWKPVIFRAEACQILLQGESEFYAEDVVFIGNQHIVVEDGFRLTAIQEDGQIRWSKEKLSERKSFWHWRYFFDEENKLQVEKNNAIAPLHEASFLL